jgi:NADH:ubiquinone oxidoreductase subunit 2 (subunit N)
LGKGIHVDVEIDELRMATAKSHPLVAGIFAFAIFSVASIPPLPGFFSKYLILKDLWVRGLDLGAYALILGSMLGLAYYLRLLVPVYMNPETANESSRTGRNGTRITVFAATLAALISVVALGGLSRLPQWVNSIETFAR